MLKNIFLPSDFWNKYFEGSNQGFLLRNHEYLENKFRRENSKGRKMRFNILRRYSATQIHDKRAWWKLVRDGRMPTASRLTTKSKRSGSFFASVYCSSNIFGVKLWIWRASRIKQPCKSITYAVLLYYSSWFHQRSPNTVKNCCTYPTKSWWVSK